MIRILIGLVGMLGTVIFGLPGIVVLWRWAGCLNGDFVNYWRTVVALGGIIGILALTIGWLILIVYFLDLIFRS